MIFKAALGRWCRYLCAVRFTLVDQDMGFSRSHDPRTAEPKVHSDRCRPARRLTKKRGRLSFRTKHFQLVPIRAYSIGCWLHIGRIREQAVHLAGNQQVLSTYRCFATPSSREAVSRLPRVAADIPPTRCRDPRDKVHAALGLAATEARDHIIPTYDKPPVDVYLQVINFNLVTSWTSWDMPKDSAISR